MSTSGASRILDRGWQRYEGQRRGVPGAVRAVATDGLRRMLGLRRSPWAKLLPLVVATLAYLPGVVFVGLTALLPGDVVNQGLLPSYAEYYGFVISAILVFTALVAPEALCPDRRNGLLSLYLAAPLTRWTYLAARALAVVAGLALVTLGPPLLLLVAFTLQGAGPPPADLAVLLLRILTAGAALTAVYAAVSMAAASLTDRRALAGAAVILVLVTSSVVTGTLVDAMGAPAGVLALNLLVVPIELVLRIHGEAGGPAGGLATATVVGANAAWTALGAAVVAVRYRGIGALR